MKSSRRSVGHGGVAQRYGSRIRRGSDHGASLILALVFVLIFSVIGAALLQASATSDASSTDHRDVRSLRYYADGATSVAINRTKSVVAAGRDPSLFTDGPCVINTSTAAGTLTTTCAAEPGSNSGKLGTPGVTVPGWPSAPSATQATPMSPRVMTFTTCVRGPSRAPSTTTSACGGTDDVLIKAKVRFSVTTVSGVEVANIPEILSWEQIA